MNDEVVYSVTSVIDEYKQSLYELKEKGIIPMCRTLYDWKSYKNILQKENRKRRYNNNRLFF